MTAETTCNGCGETFSVTDSIVKRNVEDLVITVLVCPQCKKEMTVQLDNPQTLDLYHRQLLLNRRIGKTRAFQQSITPEQERLQKALSRTLISLRNQLAAEFSDTVYQFKGETKKLDFCAPVVTITGD